MGNSHFFCQLCLTASCRRGSSMLPLTHGASLPCCTYLHFSSPTHISAPLRSLPFWLPCSPPLCHLQLPLCSLLPSAAEKCTAQVATDLSQGLCEVSQTHHKGLMKHYGSLAEASQGIVIMRYCKKPAAALAGCASSSADGRRQWWSAQGGSGRWQ